MDFISIVFKESETNVWQPFDSHVQKRIQKDTFSDRRSAALSTAIGSLINQGNVEQMLSHRRGIYFNRKCLNMCMVIFNSESVMNIVIQEK